MNVAKLVLTAVGLGFAVAVIAWYGIADVGAAFAAGGWAIAAVAAFHLVAVAIDTVAWRRLLPATPRTSAAALFLWRWIGESVNNLLPAASIGGEFARARLAIRAAMPAAATGASVVVDMTIGLIALALLAIVGLAIIAVIGDPGTAGRAILIGLAAFLAVTGAFVVAQFFGLFGRLGRVGVWSSRLFGGPALNDLAGGGQRLDQAIRDLYRQPRRLLAALGWRILGLLALGAETWLALAILGVPVGYLEALALGNLTAGIRAAAFVIPGGLGAQEGGFLVIGAMLGLAPETALAVALVRRVREVLCGLPGLVLWWWQENHGRAQPTARDA